MGLIITDKDGNVLDTLIVSNIQQKNPTKYAIIPLGGADKDALQTFGEGNRTFVFEGIARTSDEKLFLENIVNYAGSIDFSSAHNLIDYWAKTVGGYYAGDFDPNDFYYIDFYTGTGSGPVVLPYIPVYFYSLNWGDKGLRPMERKFSLEVIEIGVIS